MINLFDEQARCEGCGARVGTKTMNWRFGMRRGLVGRYLICLDCLKEGRDADSARAAQMEKKN